MNADKFWGMMAYYFATSQAQKVTFECEGFDFNVKQLIYKVNVDGREYKIGSNQLYGSKDSQYAEGEWNGSTGFQESIEPLEPKVGPRQ